MPEKEIKPELKAEERRQERADAWTKMQQRPKQVNNTSYELGRLQQQALGVVEAYFNCDKKINSTYIVHFQMQQLYKLLNEQLKTNKAPDAPPVEI